MTKRELKNAKERQERPKRNAANKLQSARKYLITSAISERTLTPSMRILTLCQTGARRGFLYPEELDRMDKLTGANVRVRTVAKAHEAS